MEHSGVNIPSTSLYALTEVLRPYYRGSDFLSNRWALGKRTPVLRVERLVAFG